MQTSRRKLMAEINLVPYIDVMLVLVVILMVTTPLLSQSIHVNLPRESSQVLPNQAREPMIITVDPHGQLFFNLAPHPTKPLPLKELLTLVAAEQILDGKATRMVLLRADREVSYGHVVRVMRLLKTSGVKDIGLLTQNSQKRREKA